MIQSINDRGEATRIFRMKGARIVLEKFRAIEEDDRHRSQQ
jgi:hypothetical protein